MPASDVGSIDEQRFRIVGCAKAITTELSATASPSKPRIPRPPNAWIIYRSQKSKEIRKKIPHATAGYISTLVSQMWKQESPEIRLTYNAKAWEAQAIHKQMYPGYKYNTTPKNLQ